MFAPQKQDKIIKKDKEYSINILIDEFSKRAWVNDYSYVNPVKLVQFISSVCADYVLEKVIFPARKEHYHELKKLGFSLEGWIEGYFKGKTAYFLTLYPDSTRSISNFLPDYLKQIKQIRDHPRKKPSSLPQDWELFTPILKDIPDLTAIFKKVFTTYPSPVDQPDYLASTLGKTALFKAVKYKKEIISVAAAEVNWLAGNAELTNCATSSEYQGAGLMSGIIVELEKECLSKKINCLYSLARASSYGMNLVFHRLGYQYRGTLINNCHINGAYEDMNIWMKYNK